MIMLQELRCKNCNGILTDTNKPGRLYCAYCGTLYIQEKEPTPPDHQKIPAQSDFIVRSAILERYNGFQRNPVIPDGIVTIGERSFAKSAITAITIPSSVHTIEPYAFADCIYLSAIVIPDSVNRIGNRAFFRCISLESVQIPNHCYMEYGDRYPFIGTKYYEHLRYLWKSEEAAEREKKGACPKCGRALKSGKCPICKYLAHLQS